MKNLNVLLKFFDGAILNLFSGFHPLGVLYLCTIIQPSALVDQSGKHINVPLVKNPLLRSLLFVSGWIFTLLALLGAILPLVPTTPFLLAAAACFYRSSGRFYGWIMHNKYFGHYLQNYKEGKGIPLKVKVVALAFTWVSTLVSAIFFIPWLWLKILVLSISAGITIHLALVKTAKKGIG